jgi:hypothetical protein
MKIHKWQKLRFWLFSTGVIAGLITLGIFFSTEIEALAQSTSWIYLPLIMKSATTSPTSHQGLFTVYEGSKTCMTCHPSSATEVHGSSHYQWRGDTPFVENLGIAGKLGGINDFCGYPDISWISQLTNLDGVIVDGGCSVCHTGMGSKPELTASQAQLENIDCLVCHSESYRRKVEMVGGQFRFVPAPERMAVPLVEGITDITLPNRATCLACHVGAGGGPNNKRGDIENAHLNPPSASFDVHMASEKLGGADLACTDCHTTENHRMSGRGVDLRETDSSIPLDCTKCHEAKPHNNSSLDRHTDRVDCTTCHIPYFAKITSTDMIRDFRTTEVYEAKRLYEPTITRDAMVVPEYLFWNGFSTFYEFGTPAMPRNNGKVLMAGPVGSINDPTAKIYPFKHHLAFQAIDPVTKRILPLKMGTLFQTGNVDLATTEGAAAVNWLLPQGYQFIQTERYMGIFHEVSPADEALACADCHEGDRMDFDALGYGVKGTREGDPLCASCHEDKSGEWAGEFFVKVHDKHVRDKEIACQECHTFTPAP